MPSDEGKQFLHALHYFLKSQSEINSLHRLIFIILSLEILSKGLCENCKGKQPGDKGNFCKTCLKLLMEKYKIDYKKYRCFKERNIQVIHSIRGSLLHWGELDRKALGDQCDELQLFFTLRNIILEIFLKKLRFSYTENFLKRVISGI